MTALLPIATGFGVFAVFLAQVVALTNPPFNKVALSLRAGTFVFWFSLLLAANLTLLESTSCYTGCLLGMNPQNILLEIAINVANACVAWFTFRGVPRLAVSR